jgi:WD40 repeat protein
MQLLDIIDTMGSPITHMIISSDDTFIIVSCDNMTVQVKSLVTGSDIHHLEGHTSEVTCLSMSNDSICCYVGCKNSYIYVYNLRSQVLLRTLTHHDSAINDLYVSSDDYFLFSAAENAIHVLNIKQQENGFLNEDSLAVINPITALSISREGDVAIAGSAAGTVRLFNLIDGEVTERITNHQGAVTQVALSHSYLFSLSGSKDTTVKVYDNELGEIVTEFTVRNEWKKSNHRLLSFLCVGLGSFSTDISCANS